MVRWRRVLFFLLAGSVASVRAHEVGYRVLRVPVGGKSIAVAVWYPTEASSRPIVYGTARVAGRAAADAPLKPGRWPLVLFAHGYSGSGTGSAAIAEGVARAGYVWAAPDFSDVVSEVRIDGPVTGNLRDALRNLKDKPPSMENHGYRVEEARAVLRALRDDPEWSIDPERIALAGHSLGGWTVVRLALDDPRPRPLVLYSMGELNYLFKNARIVTGRDLARLRGPAYLTYGERERTALRGRSPNTLYVLAHLGGPACAVEIRGGSHFVYVHREVAGRQGGTSVQLARIAQATAAFLDREFRGADGPVPADHCRNR